MLDERLAGTIAQHIDTGRIVTDAAETCDIHSPTGEERDVALHLADRLRRSGLRVFLQEVEDERCNVIGILEGRGDGPTLMLNGHMDTSFPFMPGNAGVAPMFDMPLPARRDGDWLYATGIENMKGAFAAYLGAVDAILAAGLQPKGDIVITGVVGEVETAPVSSFTGRQYRGHGHGARHLVTHGGLADYCIIGEPTNLRIGLTSCGAVWAKLTVEGPVGGSYVSRWEDNAIWRLNGLVQGLERWAAAYATRHATAEITPRVTLIGLDGGWPWRAARTPREASVYLDIRTTPEQSQAAAIRELRAALRSLEDVCGRVAVEVYATIPGQRSEAGSPLALALQQAHTAVSGEPTDFRATPATNDCTHFVRYGVPALTYGPGGARRPLEEAVPDNEYVRIANLVHCAQVYALSALDICNREGL